MCGIAGMVTSGAPVGAFVTSAIEDLRHRGPDGEGYRCASGPGWAWGLGHTRLSIVDLSPAGAQPISNEDGRLWLTFNGEIYNYAELRRTCEARGHRFRSNMDGEVILHLYEDFGTDAFDKLNGIFAFALADEDSGDAILVRDPVGVKPLFVSERDDCVYFASEINVLRDSGVPDGGSDLVALAQFLSFLWIPNPRTPYRAYRSVPPGHYVTCRRGRVDGTSRYSDLLVPGEPDRRLGRAEALERGRDVVQAAVRRQLMADVPLALMASGGIDSSLIWWGAGTALGKAYTIEWTSVDEEGLSEDAATVRLLQEELGTPVRYLDGTDADIEAIPPSGDLFADPAYGLARMISRAARDDGFKILFCGQGGDELFAGYRRHRFAPMLGTKAFRLAMMTAGPAFRRRTGLTGEYVSRLYRAAAESDFFRAYMRLCTYSSPADRAAALDCSVREVSDEVVWQQHRDWYDALPSGISRLRKALSLDQAVYMPGLGLSYMDRAGMESGVEIRVPWLDLEVVRWSLTLPDSLLSKPWEGKSLPKRLARAEMTDVVARRPKRGFAAPTTALRRPRSEGALGHRQGVYFAKAHELLVQFRSSNDRSSAPGR